MSDSEIRDQSKRIIESVEYWIRRLIDDQLAAAYGNNYFVAKKSNSEPVIKSSIQKDVESRIRKNPERYTRQIDAILLDDAISIVCNPNLYSIHFRSAIKSSFIDIDNLPECDVIRMILNRLVQIRNKLYHANPISQHEATRALCYSLDIINSIKAHYSNIGMNEQYNVPLILKVSDHFGNVVHRTQFNESHDGMVSFDFSRNNRNYLWSGDTLKLELEIDPNFDPSTYSISWKINYSEVSAGTSLSLAITDAHVALKLGIHIEIVTKNTWHRMHGRYDDFLVLNYRVLPAQ